MTLETDSAPSAVVANGAGCLGTPGGYTITASATGGTGTLSYSINGGGSYQASNIFTITSVGTYTIRVKDVNGCTVDSNPVTVAPQLTVSAVLNKDITCTAPAVAQITVTPTGGAGPFTYSSSPNTGTFAGNVFTTNTPGNYTFTVTDANLCSASTTTAIVVTPTVDPDITGIAQTQSINCNGDDTAAINITIDNTKGLAPFVFNVLNTTTGTNYGTQTSGLAAGNYTITVTDAKGCTDTGSITIAQPLDIVVASHAVPITCNGAGISKGSVIVDSVTGGVGPYDYIVTGVNGYNNSELNNAGTTSVSFNVVDFGLYQINVVDANGCSKLVQNVLVASPPNDLDITVSPAPGVCSGLGSAVVAISPSNTSIGTGPFYFSLYTGSVPSYPTGTWLAETPAGSKQTTFNNLIPGVTYTFVVYDAAPVHGGTGTGCYYYETAEFPIGTSSTITVNPLVGSNITCKGSADGNVTFTMNQTYGVDTPVKYQIYNSQNVTPIGGVVSATIPASGSLTVNNFGTLPFGYYFVLITEDTGATNAGCSVSSAPFSITQSAIDLSVTASKIKNVNCNEDGVIAAQAKDGTAPYTYQYLLATATAPTAATAGWTGNTTFATSVTGNYIVYAKDAYGCIKTATVTLDADDAPTVTPPVAPLCYDGTAFTITFSGTVDPDIVGGATYSVNGSAFQSSPSFTFNAAGTYNLVIKDGNGCTANVDFEVYPKLNLSASLTKELDCSTNPEAVINLTATGGNTIPASNYTYEVSFNGGGFVAATNPYDATTAGNYVFRVTDGNNTTLCQTTTSFDLDPIPTTVFNTSVTNVSCNGGADGTITVNVTSGVGPYEYQLDGGIFQSSNVFAGLSQGTSYVVTVRNAKNCTLSSGPITITEPGLLAATASVTPFGCSTGNVPQPAVVKVTASSGTGPYTYNFDGSSVYSNDNTSSIAIPVTITEPGLLAATASVTPFGCSTGNVPQPAVVTVTASSGTGPYTYNFDGSSVYSNDNTLVVNDNGSMQTIHYYVKDANGCTFDATINVDPYLTLTDITFAVATAPVCPGNVADITLTVAGGYTPMAKYEIISPITVDNGTNATFAGLAPDTYLFKVTDAYGCSIERNYTVAPVTPIAIAGIMLNDISCNAADGTTNNGSAQFTVTGFSATGNYSVVTSPAVASGQISHTGDVITLTGLSAGTYTVTVEDNTTHCSANADVTITEPDPIAFTAFGTKVFCSQDISTITVSGVTGGTGAYTYAVVAGGATAPAATAYTSSSVLTVDTNLTDLSWDVYVKDANGCIHIENVTITNDAPPAITVPAAQCYTGANLTVDLSTLTTTYNNVKSYTVDGSAIATSTATFTSPGTYKLGIKDDNGCEAFVNYTIEKQLLATATLTKDLYCAGSVDATIDVVITDGVAPYTYQMYVDGVVTGSVTGVTGSGFTASVSAAGSYTFVITDSNAAVCSVTTNAAVVTTPATPIASAVPTAVICNGESNGTITVTASDGVAPFSYALTGAGANTTGNTTGAYTGLIAGTDYEVVVTDAKGCASIAIPVTITEPGLLAATASVTPFGCDLSNNAKDAIVTITATGGTTDYTYSFDGGSTFQTSASFTVNTAQTINYVVLDANGCRITGTTAVTPYLPPTDMDLSASPIYCNTSGNAATVTVNAVAGGAAPYRYEIISPASAATAPSLTNSFANLVADTYIIKVTDNNGCSTTKAIVVEEADKISATHQIINDVYCKGDNTGSANFTVSNYITAGSYTFNLTMGATTISSFTQSGDVISYTTLAEGNYTFTVTDNVSGCSAQVNFRINEPAVALSSTSVATNINCNEDNATITITATGGTGSYRYAVAKAGDPAPTTGFVASNQLTVDTSNGTDVNWVVYVLDSNNCPATNTQLIQMDLNPTIVSAVPTQCPSATGTYEITVTAAGFSTALLYSIDGVSFDSNNVITVNAPGIYNVTVKDANGCSSAVTQVTILEPLVLTPTVTTSPSCTDGDGVVEVSTTGGSGNYIYNIDGGAFGAATPLTGVHSGSHIIGVQDTTTLCEVFVPINLTPATRITGFVLNPTHVTCNGGNDGTITAIIDTPAPGINDNPKYTYSLNGGTPQDSNIFNNLVAGNYTITVRSERGCSETLPITINEPLLIAVNSVAVSQFVCTTGNTSNFATITVDPTTGVTGGSGNYLVYEFFKNGTQVQKGSSNTYTEYDLAGGTYTVNVYDSNGCMGTYAAPILIDGYIAIDKINVVNTAITCNNAESITATAVDAAGVAVAGIQYSLVDVKGTVSFPSNTTGNFTGIPVGNYIITALNPVTGCSIDKPHYVNEPNTFYLNAVKTSDVVCYGSNEGSVSITLVDNIGNPDEAGRFSYTVSGPVASSGTTTTAGPLDLSGLTAGEYTVSATLIDSPFCTVSTTFVIGQPDARLEISETHTLITCISGNNDGSISVSATGGWSGAYEFQLENSTGVVSVWSTTRDYTNLTAENYIIRVRDSKQCIASVNVSLVIPTPISVVATPDMTIVPCYGSESATITATNVTGGEGKNYSYTLNRITMDGIISSGPQNLPSFSGLGAGTYSITVTDGFTCSGTSAQITITEPTIVTPLLVHSGNATCLTQDSLTLSASGGTEPYTYSTDANFTTVLGSFTESSPMTFNVTPGEYKYFVKDANGCVGFVSNGINVSELPMLDVDVDVRSAVVNCKGDTTGVIVATATGGLGNYVYSLINDVTKAVVQGPKADGNFADLAAGDYTVHVVSVDCEYDSAVIPITEPTDAFASTFVKTDVTCNGNKDGKVVITTTGGTGAIYAISPNMNQFFDDGTFTNLEPGSYTVLVQDPSAGCYHFIDFVINEPTPLYAALIPDTMLPEQCKGEKNGSFSIEITGATGPYSYSLDVRNGTYTTGAVGQTRFDFDNLSGGRHIVYIKDAEACTYELEVLMDDAVVLDPQYVINYDCVNNAAANSVTITVDPSITNLADVDYALDGIAPYQASNIFTNVAPGTHFVMARHTNGCEVPTANFVIKAIAPLNLIVTPGQQEMNVISVTASGGSPAYMYSFNGEDFTSSNTYKIYKSGDYKVIVRDQNGCTFELIVPMTYVDVCIPNYFTPNGDGLYDEWGPGCTNIYNNLEFSIFDRYGREIAKYRYGQKWNGKYNGEELPTGDYWYVLKLNDKKDDREFVGHFTLYR
ncbi:T9SS type B sorting domain-containing protein [Flavobacterium fluviatile]|uniref:T9SS type B sorting domain-containing protein n=1 Tax=Flavobacterium fluviatile TaxID=1862387 RepID=UPI001AD643DD|nr:T9SS type B sorting domain-containing protein [Flavobacterium fluviatile]